jgi:hypothetical protein
VIPAGQAELLVFGAGLLPARRGDHAEQLLIVQRCQVFYRLAGQRAEHRPGRHHVRRLVLGEPRAGKPGQVRILPDADHHAGGRFLRGDLDAPGVGFGDEPVQVAVVFLGPVPRRGTGQRLIVVVPGAGERVLCHGMPPSVQMDDDNLIAYVKYCTQIR